MSACPDPADLSNMKVTQNVDNLLRTLVGGECSTLDAYARGQAGALGPLGPQVSAEAGVSISTGCEQVAANFSNTVSAMVNQTCLVSENEFRSENIQELKQVVNFNLDVRSSDGNVTIDGITSRQYNNWKATKETKFDVDIARQVVQSLSSGLSEDLSAFAVSERETPLGTQASQIATQIADTFVTQASNDMQVVQNLFEDVVSLKIGQSKDMAITVRARGDVSISNIEISQENYVDAAFSAAFGNVIDSVIKQSGALEVTKAMSTSATSTVGLTGDVWIILGIVVMVLVLGGGIYWWKKRQSRKQPTD